jgi:phosphoribosyl-dephospho-CoA transferase
MLRRHDLLRAAPATWNAMLQCHPGLADLPLVVDWARLGRPVIMRRRTAGDFANGVPAAPPLPPSHGKQRLAFSLFSGAGVVALPPCCFARQCERRRRNGSRSSLPCSTLAIQ